MSDFRELGLGKAEQSTLYWFERQVEESPDRIAVKSTNHEFSYRELNRAANRLARAILAMRGPVEEPVPLLFEQDVPMVIGMLAAWKAGKFFVPLSSSAPPARNAYVLSDTEARLVIAGNRHVPLARDMTDQVLNMDELDPGLSDDNPGLPVGPDTNALLIYTSGSTGDPKGVLYGHRQFVSALHSFTESVGISADDRFLQLYALTFTAAALGVFGSFVNGASLFLYNVRAQGLQALARWMLREEVTLYTSVSTTLRHFMTVLSGEEGFPKLRTVFVGGEPLYGSDLELYRRLFPSTCALVTRYGTTETWTILQNRIDRTTPIQGDVVLAGYPVPGMGVLLVDETGEPVEMGEVGEIVARSGHLALGYWRDRELTQARFRPDPDGGNARMYFTGDLGRMRRDGCIALLGRKDDQVKIRGYRVELAEIEKQLLSHEGITEAAVVLRDDRSGEKRLVAYIVPTRKPSPATGELRHWVRHRVPDYMIPSVFVALDALPVTPSGKVDRNALQQREDAPPRVDENLVPPRDALELELVRLWEALLDVQPIGLRDDFFELGGNSLLVLRMLAQVECVFGPRLPAHTLLQASTVEKLAEVIRRQDPTSDWSTVVVMQRGESRPPLFLVHTFGGNVLDYRELVRLLGPDQPVYGLLAKRTTDVQGRPPSRLEEMAAHYVHAVRSVQPSGPYYLGGFCVAGHVAFEMARQLHELGERVALLAVVDALAPLGADDRLSFWHRNAPIGFFRNLPHWVRTNVPNRYGHLLKRTAIRVRGGARTAWRRLVRRQSALDALALEDFLGDTSRIPETSRHVMARHFRAFRNYRPQSYPGQVTLFRAQAMPLLRAHDPELGWGRLAARGVDLRVIAGSNHDMLQEPHVRNLAVQLRASLTEAQARTR